MKCSEVIIVRSLADSDMGIIAGRKTTSNQRAIALTTFAAEQLLHPSLMDEKGGDFDCICIYGNAVDRERRLINKSGKNWRLCGSKLAGKEFASLESKDFVLIRSIAQNDGSSPILITFIGRRSQKLIQAGLAATLVKSLHQSVAVFDEASDEFKALAELFPPVPAQSRDPSRRAAAGTSKSMSGRSREHEGDVHSPGVRSYNMSRIRGRDTKPELLIRRGLHARGLRFRLHRRDLPGRPDLVFPARHAVILIHGCFWHGHDCPMFHLPATRREFWTAKIAANCERDARASAALAAAGWRQLVVWECALRGPARRPETETLNACECFLRGIVPASELLGTWTTLETAASSTPSQT